MTLWHEAVVPKEGTKLQSRFRLHGWKGLHRELREAQMTFLALNGMKGEEHPRSVRRIPFMQVCIRQIAFGGVFGGTHVFMVELPVDCNNGDLSQWIALLYSFTDMSSPSDLLTRAVETVVPRDLAERKLKSGKPIRLYLGIDPTGAKLHIGHSVPLRKLKSFQEAGHEVIFLIGSFTATIGDPSGRDQLREPLTLAKVEENFQTYKNQAAKILDLSKVKIVYNHEWLGKLKFDEIVKLASNVTVQQMLDREMFQRRIAEGKPIGVHEFLYPLMQGYDSVMLDVDCELGGNDQLFNILCGRTLQAAYGKREKFALTTRLIEGTDGRKMSKTYNNCVYLEDEPADMFGKVMSVKDDLMETYFECCTDVPMEEAKKILGGKPRDAKARLAREIVTLYHGKEAAAKAEESFNRVFKDKGLPEDIPEVKVKKGTALIDVLVSSKLVSSKSEARRVIEQGGVKMNNKVVQSIEQGIEEGIVQVGKRKFLRIVV
ncbi:MAG: tyrosine--tRNA ligase [Candidatus Peribacter sp.]|nr:tyrosine--tRNA ligase [Candidatus Peribacter sp.]